MDTITGEIAHAQPRPQPDLPPGITEYDVAPASCPVTVQAHSPEEAVALVVREQEQEEAEYGKYAGDPDPNPRYTSGKPASCTNGARSTWTGCRSCRRITDDSER